MNVSRETSEVPEAEEPAFVLTIPAYRIELDALPQSARKVFKLAEALHWETRAWHSAGLVAPTLFVDGSKENDKNQHVAGDVRYEGYTANRYIVEARDPASRAIGFQCRFLGKDYQSGKKGTAGSFENAHVTDPVGIPRVMHAEYKLIRPSRDKYETEKSFGLRVKAVDDLLSGADRKYNDGTLYYPRDWWFDAAGDFESWLNEWRPYFV